jgi:hypothetical protein
MHVRGNSEHGVRRIAYTLEGVGKTDLLATYHDYAFGECKRLEILSEALV